MTPQQIQNEIRSLVSLDKTPGQAFDNICRLRKDNVTYEDIVKALAVSNKSPVKTEDGYTDLTPMPFGKHRGKTLQNVPASYLHWLWQQTPLQDQRLEAYIKNNLPVLKEAYPEGSW